MFDMEFIAVQVALAVLLGLNLLVLLLVWSEYTDNKTRFLKYVAQAQALVFLWHLNSAALVYAGNLPLLQAISLALFFLLNFFMLAAVTETRHTNDKLVYQVAAAGFVAVTGLGFISPAVLNSFWGLSVLLMGIVPVFTLLYFRQVAARLIAFMQAVIAVMFLSSAAFFNIDSPDLGGLFYLLVGLFQPILTVLLIISSIRLARRQVVLRERDYRVFFESVNEVFFRIELDGTVEEISPSVSQFGVSPGQITGNRLQEYLTDSNDFFTLLDSLISGRKPITYRGNFSAGDKLTDCEVICSKIHDAETGRIYFAGSIRNTQERNLLERQFIEAQRHESLGVLAGGMAHDFNNLLQGIIGYTELMTEAKDLDDKTRSQGLNAILKASTTAGELCKQLLQYTGKGIKSRDIFNLTEEITKTVGIIRPACPDGVSITLDLPDDLTYVEGDRSQVGQIVLNLLRNAIDAVESSGEIQVQLSPCFLNEADIKNTSLPAKLVPGDYFQLEVSDNGKGINPIIMSRIFDPFFTTKDEGHGLGLSAVKGILKIHQGAITVNSVHGNGTVFRILLPALVNTQINDTSERKRQAMQGILVLLVEDDNVVREVAGKTLERAGYKVLEAKDGLDALRVMGLSREPVRLVVTDVRMPNMDGIELAHKLQNQIPGMPIVLISGYADVSEAMERAQSLTFQFVPKPFRGNDLVDAVAKAAEQIRLGNSRHMPEALEN